MRRGQRGFTLIELLIVIGIIGFLAAAILVAVDPVRRIQDARNSQRWSEVNALLNAILNKQVDERVLVDGTVAAEVDSNFNSAQVIVRETGGINCTSQPAAPSCPGAVVNGLTYSIPTAGTLDCVVQLHDGTTPENGIDPDYIAELPLDPAYDSSSHDPTPTLSDLVIGDNNTGYYINRSNGNRIEIGACHPDQGAIIRVKR